MELTLAQINGSNPFPEEDTSKILSIANYTYTFVTLRNLPLTAKPILTKLCKKFFEWET